MINLNDELTYYKEKQFINYCMGAFQNEGKHDYDGLDAYYFDEWGMKHFTIDYSKEEDRRLLSKLIFRKIKSDESAYRMFRCDFDWRRFEAEKSTSEEDWEMVRGLFEIYCKTYNISGFLFTHFAQEDEENYGCYLAKHIHIVYQEPFGGDSFSEFLHKHM